MLVILLDQQKQRFNKIEEVIEKIAHSIHFRTERHEEFEGVITSIHLEIDQK